MPTTLKKLVRARMEKTGESYQQALRHVRAEDGSRREGPKTTLGPATRTLTPTRCIYCAAALTTTTRWAHVWPKSMGGRLQSREICCDNCNNAIGQLEDQLRSNLLHVNATMGAHNGDGMPIVAPLEIDGQSFHISGPLVNLQVSGASYDRGAQRLAVPLPAGFTNQVGAVGKHLMRQGRTAADLAIEPGQEPHLPPSGRRTYDLKIGASSIDKRVFAKMAIELLAFFDHSLALRPELAEIRRFIRDGVGTLQSKPDRRSRGSGIPLPLLSEMFNLIEVWSFKRALYFRVTFLKWISFTGTLTTSWEGGKFRAAYGFDARKPAQWFKKADRRDGFNLSVWFPEMRDEVSQTAAKEFEAESARLMEITEIPPRELPPTIEKLRDGVTEWLAKQPRRAKRTPRSSS